MSNYIWDTQKGQQTGAAAGAEPFEKMQWLAEIVTLGCIVAGLANVVKQFM